MKRLALTLVLAAVGIYALGPWLRSVDMSYYSYGQEARAESSHIQELTANELNQMVKQQATPTMVLMYASWCPYCQKQIPILMSLKQEFAGKFAVIAISIDQSKTQLADYLLKHHAHDGFTTYHMPKAEFAMYQTFFKQFGGNFRGGIPYMGLFDASGTMVLEIPGLAQKPDLKAAINEALTRK